MTKKINTYSPDEIIYEQISPNLHHVVKSALNLSGSTNLRQVESEMDKGQTAGILLEVKINPMTAAKPTMPNGIK